MKKSLLIFLTIAVVITFLILASGTYFAYIIGYGKGFKIGDKEAKGGYEKGYETGNKDGYKSGFDKCIERIKIYNEVSGEGRSKISLTEPKFLEDPNGQWANWADASSFYSPDSWSPEQATGAPNVFAYGDDPNAWAPAEIGKGKEILALNYAEPVYATEVRIKESYGSGTVIKVSLVDVDGNFHKIWEGNDPTEGLDYFVVKTEKTSYKVNGVSINFDTKKSPSQWVEIDAVQLVGEK